MASQTHDRRSDAGPGKFEARRADLVGQIGDVSVDYFPVLCLGYRALR